MMKPAKPSRTSIENYNYGLVIEEIKLQRSINMIDRFNQQDKPQYLMNEISNQKEQLNSLRELKLSEK